jgi:hypothetical protein
VRNVDLVYFNAGGGHRAAALALRDGIALHGLPWRVRLVNLTEVLDPTQSFERLTGLAPEDLYNKRLARGWTLGFAQELKLLQGGIRLLHDTLVERLQAHWARTQPGLVVSLIPNFNRALATSVARACPGVPFVTVMTDLADLPPNFWAAPGTAQHLVCGTDFAAEQARAQGLPPAQVHRAAGMLLHPSFHTEAPLDANEREAERLRLGLPCHEPVGLVMFGGQGARVMKRIARDLPTQPLILMCGRHAALAETLRSEAQISSGAAARVVVEYTPQVARWMQMADYFIGKPGPGSLSEAVQMGLPVIVTRNALTMPQERWNTQWVRELGVGQVLENFKQLPAAIEPFLAELPALRLRAAAVSNRALFDVPRLLQRLWAQAEDVSIGQAA